MKPCSVQKTAIVNVETENSLGFVAVNYIDCQPDYNRRFEELFSTRAGAIDRLPGFRNMHVLKPHGEGEPYLIVSFWNRKEDFDAWTKSPEFLEGHKRGFDDLRKAKEAGLEPPMKSTFRTYDILTD